MKIDIQKTDRPKARPDEKSLGFGRIFTDHMLVAKYEEGRGWLIQHMGNTSDLAERIRDLRAPALLVWGRQDPVCPLAWGEELHRELPDSELHVLDGCGHCPPEERPAELAALLIDFFARRGPRLPRPIPSEIAAGANGSQELGRSFPRRRNDEHLH